MDPYFKLNTLIADGTTSIEKITDFIKRNLVSADTFEALEGSHREAKLSCPLGVAAVYGRWDVMKALFAVGFDPRALYGCFLRFDPTLGPYWVDCSAIHLAAQGGSRSVINSLVEDCDVDVNAEDSDHFCAIHRVLISGACRSGERLKIVKYLVEAGADIEKGIGGLGLKPIHLAASRRCLDTSEYLLSKGAKVIKVANPKGSAIAYAASKGNDVCIHLLLQNAKGLNPHEVFNSGSTLLHICAEYGHIESVKLLCWSGWNPDAQKSCGETPLHVTVDSIIMAAQIRYSTLYFLIVEQNASMHLKDTDGATSFDKALAIEDVPIVELFLSAGYQISVESRSVVQDILLEMMMYESESIEKILTNPRTLQDLCCFRVRRILGLRLPSVVDSLPVPNLVKDFVRLEHVVKPMK